MSRIKGTGKAVLEDLLVANFPGAWGVEPRENGSNVAVIRSTNVDDDGRINYAMSALRRFSSAEIARKILRDGDTLLEASGGGPGKPVGRVAYFHNPGDQKYATSNFFRVLRPNKGVHPKYLAWSLLHAYRQPTIWNYQQQTTGIINLKVRDYLRQHVFLPSLQEQRRITEILDSVDESVRSAERLSAKLELRYRGILQYLVDSIDGSTSAWSTARQEFEIKSGVTLGPHRRPRRHPVDYLRVANVQRNLIDYSEISQLEASPADVATYALRAGDLLVVEGHASPSQIGRCAVVRDNRGPLLFQNHLFRLRPRALSPEYAVLWLNSSYVRSYWRRMCATSSGLYTINSRQLRGLPVRTPEPSEQERVIQIARAHEDVVRRERGRLQKLQRLQHGLMEDLLTGRVRAKVGRT